jgi:hypothetical protein
LDHRNIKDQMLSLHDALSENRSCVTRRRFLIAQLLAGLPLALSNTPAWTEIIDPSETQVTLPDAIDWRKAPAGWRDQPVQVRSR